MNRERSQTLPLGERVATLENEAWSQATKIAKHEEAIRDHEKWFNQVRGSMRTLAILWGIAVAMLGFKFLQDFVTRPVSAASAKP